ncbi:hypothetical protein V8F20_002015 [Naviculisporaceae sp. PSN 640]
MAVAAACLKLTGFFCLMVPSGKQRSRGRARWSSALRWECFEIPTEGRTVDSLNLSVDVDAARSPVTRRVVKRQTIRFRIEKLTRDMLHYPTIDSSNGHVIELVQTKKSTTCKVNLRSLVASTFSGTKVSTAPPPFPSDSRPHFAPKNQDSISASGQRETGLLKRSHLLSFTFERVVFTAQTIDEWRCFAGVGRIVLPTHAPLRQESRY